MRVRITGKSKLKSFQREVDIEKTAKNSKCPQFAVSSEEILRARKSETNNNIYNQ